jgi:hypothetical protein
VIPYASASSWKETIRHLDPSRASFTVQNFAHLP